MKRQGKGWDCLPFCTCLLFTHDPGAEPRRSPCCSGSVPGPCAILRAPCLGPVLCSVLRAPCSVPGPCSELRAPCSVPGLCSELRAPCSMPGPCSELRAACSVLWAWRAWACDPSARTCLDPPVALGKHCLSLLSCRRPSGAVAPWFSGGSPGPYPTSLSPVTNRIAGNRRASAGPGRCRSSLAPKERTGCFGVRLAPHPEMRRVGTFEGVFLWVSKRRKPFGVWSPFSGADAVSSVGGLREGARRRAAASSTPPPPGPGSTA